MNILSVNHIFCQTWIKKYIWWRRYVWFWIYHGVKLFCHKKIVSDYFYDFALIYRWVGFNDHLTFGFLGDWRHIWRHSRRKNPRKFIILYIFSYSIWWSISVAFFTLSAPGSGEKIDLMIKYGFLGWNDVIYNAIAEEKSKKISIFL